MWTNYRLTLHIDRIVGGIPRHPKIIKAWQEARWPKGENLSAELAAQGITPEKAAETTIESLGNGAQSEEEVAGVWTTFAMYDGHPVIESRQIKAMLKESANIIKDMPEARVKDKKGNSKAIPLRSKLAERVFPIPKWLPILSETSNDFAPLVMVKNDETGQLEEQIPSVERPIHVMTMQGPRTALKRTDYFDNVSLSCVLRVLSDGLISENILRAILDHASLNGIGTDRSQGAGMFTYELEKLED